MAKNKNNNKRNWIREEEKLDLEGSLASFRVALNEAAQTLINKGINEEDLYLEVEKEHGYYDDINFVAKLYGSRLETDAEMETRIKHQVVAAQKSRDFDMQQYMRLKEKLGL